MSMHSDETNLVASSDSFWEPGNYKRTTKRIEDGFRLCNDLIQLINERSDIEKLYAKSLRNWAKKWNETIEKGPEYGTTEAAWKGVLTEGERLCDLHLSIRDRLHKEAIHSIKQWQKENFHKSMIHIKEKKDMDDAFKRAQKPWVKLLSKVQKTKVEYHQACKNEKSAINNERNLSTDNSVSPDQIKKAQDRVVKSKEEVQKTKERYEIALEDLNHLNPKYMDDMTQVFEKCQIMEEARLDFFKNTLLQIHSCLNISASEELPRIYDECRHTIQNADSEKDLKWWSNNHGVRMAMNWPEFEPYTPELTTISKKEKKTNDLPVKLTNVNHAGDKPIILSSNSNTTNPFDEEWEDEEVGPLVDNGEPGVPVKALYDYEGAEDDELTFKQGDIFEKLEDEDEQGWCKGRKDNRVGLYPANYVELVK